MTHPDLSRRTLVGGTLGASLGVGALGALAADAAGRGPRACPGPAAPQGRRRRGGCRPRRAGHRPPSPATVGRCCSSRRATGSEDGCSTTGCTPATRHRGRRRVRRPHPGPHPAAGPPAAGADVQGVRRRQQRLRLVDPRSHRVLRHRPARPDDPSRRRPPAAADRLDRRRDRRRRPLVAPEGARLGLDDARRLHPRQRGPQPPGRLQPDPPWTQPGFGADPASCRCSSRSGTSRARATSATSAPSPATPTPPTARRSAASSAARSSCRCAWPSGLGDVARAARPGHPRRPARPPRGGAHRSRHRPPSASSSPPRPSWCSASTGSPGCPCSGGACSRPPTWVG